MTTIRSSFSIPDRTGAMRISVPKNQFILVDTPNKYACYGRMLDRMESFSPGFA